MSLLGAKTDHLKFWGLQAIFKFARSKISHELKLETNNVFWPLFCFGTVIKWVTSIFEVSPTHNPTIGDTKL